jgi:hypothetical protein
VAAVHTSAQKVEAQPSPTILVIRLVGKVASAENFAEIFCLDELSILVDLANSPHREERRSAFCHQRSQKAPIIPSMRVPVAIQSAEASRRERFIYGGEHPHPRISASHPSCMPSEQGGEVRVEQARVARPTAMMHEARDDIDT